MKYTKIIAAISVFILIVSAFCACEITFGEEPTTTTTTTTESTTESTEADTTTTTTTTVTKVETDSLDTLLNLIKDYPIGTAGSTAKAVDIANRLLNFTENSNFEIDEVKNDYNNFLSNLSHSQKLIYEENLVEIDYMARKIIGDISFPEKYISDYVPFAEDGKIELSNYESLYDVISK